MRAVPAQAERAPPRHPARHHRPQARLRAQAAGVGGRAMRPLDLSGQRFGRLTAIAFTGKTGPQGRVWACRCECGRAAEVPVRDLRSGHSRSCGCGQRQAAARACEARATHGKRGTRLYTIWRAMIQRCECKSNIGYARYGGRGISVCAEWRGSFAAFSAWAHAAGYSEDLSIDRVNPNGSYEPSNCRWATAKEQANNRNPRQRRAA